MSEQGLPYLAFFSVLLLYSFTFNHPLNFGDVAFSKRKSHPPCTSAAHNSAEAFMSPVAAEGWKGCEARADRSTDPELNVEQKEEGSYGQERREPGRERRTEKAIGEG